MDKHYTIMVVPGEDKNVKSFKVPSFFFKSLAVVVFIFSCLIGIFIYDYWKILGQIHENKHLTQENKQLREQVQLFQMKMNSLNDDLERITILEKKLRIISGLEDRFEAKIPLKAPSNETMMDDHSTEEIKETPKRNPQSSINYNRFDDEQKMLLDKEYQSFKKLYDEKIAKSLGFQDHYKITRRWSELIKSSFALAKDFASFDYRFSRVKESMFSIEEKLNSLDQFLLDKTSILRSTPTILPSNGWITSYFGHRISPHSGKRKMHEGLDVGAKYGTPIIAPGDAVVTFAGKKTGFGLFVQLDHGYGVETLYAHSQKLHVKRGDKVSRGELIAEVGSTGYSTGPHLHYEVRINGIAVDPLYFVLQ